MRSKKVSWFQASFIPRSFFISGRKQEIVSTKFSILCGSKTLILDLKSDSKEDKNDKDNMEDNELEFQDGDDEDQDNQEQDLD